jgi:hypothetical protein
MFIVNPIKTCKFLDQEEVRLKTQEEAQRGLLDMEVDILQVSIWSTCTSTCFSTCRKVSAITTCSATCSSIY